MKRLALALAILSIPLAAQAANVTDWVYEEQIWLLEELRHTCSMATHNNLVCYMRFAKDEANALHWAQNSLDLCAKHPAAFADKCPAVRAYIKSRWNF